MRDADVIARHSAALELFLSTFESGAADDDDDSDIPF